ncbi:MAG: class I SAM-dependent methyltransferase, partial [bacterium]
LLERGAERAAAERLSVDFQTADAEALPFADARFDAVLSAFGVMFTPHHETAAAELLRVCRPGGCIGLANWTPGSVVGEMFRVLGSHLPPPPGLRPPSMWGTREHLQALFGDGASRIEVQSKIFNFRFRSPSHFVEVFRAWYGPVHKAFAALPPDSAVQLEKDLVSLRERCNRATGCLVAPSEYLEIVIHRR